MDKKTLLGLVAMALVFIGFAYLNGKDQQRYQEELARYEAYQDSVRRATQPEVAADSTATETLVTTTIETPADAEAASPAEQAYNRQVELLGAELATAELKEAEELTLENEVMTLRLSTRGGQVSGVQLKDSRCSTPSGSVSTSRSLCVAVCTM